MKISTEIESTAKHIGEEKAVELVARAGFDAWDFSMFDMCEKRNGVLVPTSHPSAGDEYLSFAKKLRQIGLDNGIHCNQAHAPFPSSIKSIDYLKRALECAGTAGAEVCVIHPMNNGTPQENAEMYNLLLPTAKEFGVKIATENMWNWSKLLNHSKSAACSTPKSFNAHLDAVNDDYFVACLDIGHAEMRGSKTNAVKMIKALGNRLQALHIHDNDKHHDSHKIPFSMKIDFLPIVKALKEVGYKGYFTLEASYYIDDFTNPDCFKILCELKNSAQKLADMYEEC